ncbi:MAG: sugar ABC transporter permease [Oscillospiraceae bacterium]|jgi:multiple sugar transport system permease protein|nr:sugar ABC transporter permease [Oscillospiraceae bacterium]
MRKIRRKLRALGLVCISGYMLLYILPLVIAAGYSVVDSPVRRAFVGLSHYRAVLTNDYFRLAVGNTLRLALLTVPLVLLAAIVIAYWLQDGQRLWLISLLVLPMFLPSAAVAMVYKQLFDPFQGLLLAVLPASALPLLSLVVFFLWRYLGFFALLMLSGYRSLPPSLHEAAQLDGLSPWGAYRRIALPCLRPVLLFCAVMGLAYNLRLYREAYILYGAYPSESVYLLLHYQQNHFVRLNYANLSVSSIVLLIPVALLMGIALRLDHRWREDLS